MTIAIPLGWWLVPLAVTLAAFGWAVFVVQEASRRDQGGLFPLGGVLACLIFLPVAVALSLVAWLAWALLA